MKTSIIKLILALSASSILFTGCTVNNTTDKGGYQSPKESLMVEIELDKQNYDTSVNEIHLTIKNTGSENISYGADFRIDKYENNGWEPVQTKSHLLTNEGYIMTPRGEITVDLKLALLNLPLVEGKYRVVKEFYSDKNRSSSEKVTATAEFKVTHS